MTDGGRTADKRAVADLTGLCERLAVRLYREGKPHPLPAAVALAVRGKRGIPAEEQARTLGVTPELLCRIEDGGLPFADLPPSLVEAARRTEGLDLDALRLWRS